ncbi:hypothetical protein Tco_1019503 [Tanacetum coccineum]|uniref:Uncharacterized protein n=1 Tax=Tanacetum coccineum TaxID=301880 RepID=A0ABQ5FXC4_9ASTR
MSNVTIVGITASPATAPKIDCLQSWPFNSSKINLGRWDDPWEGGKKEKRKAEREIKGERRKKGRRKRWREEKRKEGGGKGGEGQGGGGMEGMREKGWERWKAWRGVSARHSGGGSTLATIGFRKEEEGEKGGVSRRGRRTRIGEQKERKRAVGQAYWQSNRWET